jgi:ubiquinone/menaquinone biosynthesis C-methylase UbiE
MEEAQMVNSSTDICSYQRAWALDFWIRKYIHNPYKILGEYIKDGQTVLDLGCGPGYFSLAMAEMIGEKGRVISVDIQDEMLQMLRDKSERAGLKSRIIPHKAQPDMIGLSEMVDFALAFYMVHEVPDKSSFLREVALHLKPDGRFLLVEPKFHVSKPDFGNTLKIAQSAGLKQVSEPKILLSRAALLIKA